MNGRPPGSAVVEDESVAAILMTAQLYAYSWHVEQLDELAQITLLSPHGDIVVAFVVPELSAEHARWGAAYIANGVRWYHVTPDELAAFTHTLTVLSLRR